MTASVLANASISAVRVGFDSAIREVSRVLVDHGLFVMAVPTSQFYHRRRSVHLLRTIGAAGWATRYVQTLDRRFDHYSGFEEQAWRNKLEAAHFQVEQVRYYLTPPQAFWFHLLTAQLFRVFGLLQLGNGTWVARLAAHVQERLFPRLPGVEQDSAQATRAEQAGYLLFVARKRAEEGS